MIRSVVLKCDDIREFRKILSEIYGTQLMASAAFSLIPNAVAYRIDGPSREFRFEFVLIPEGYTIRLKTEERVPVGGRVYVQSNNATADSSKLLDRCLHKVGGWWSEDRQLSLTKDTFQVYEELDSMLNAVKRDEAVQASVQEAPKPGMTPGPQVAGQSIKQVTWAEIFDMFGGIVQVTDNYGQAVREFQKKLQSPPTNAFGDEATTLFQLPKVESVILPEDWDMPKAAKSIGKIVDGMNLRSNCQIINPQYTLFTVQPLEGEPFSLDVTMLSASMGPLAVEGSEPKYLRTKDKIFVTGSEQGNALAQKILEELCATAGGWWSDSNTLDSSDYRPMPIRNGMSTRKTMVMVPSVGLAEVKVFLEKIVWEKCTVCEWHTITNGMVMLTAVLADRTVRFILTEVPQTVTLNLDNDMCVDLRRSVAIGVYDDDYTAELFQELLNAVLENFGGYYSGDIGRYLAEYKFHKC